MSATVDAPRFESLTDPAFKKLLQELRQTDNWRNWFYLVRTYALLALVVVGAVWFYQQTRGSHLWLLWNVPVFAAAIAIVGALQHHMATLAHEAVIFPSGAVLEQVGRITDSALLDEASSHAGGMLVGLRSIPLGAKDITDDIACAYGVQRRDAERLKCFYGSAMTSPRDNHEMIEARQMGSDEGVDPMRITRAQLMTVIRQRVEELTAQVEEALKSLGFTGPVGRQVVLTGGGAELKNIADYMQGVLGRSVRVGRPKQLTGLPDAHSGPAFSTLVGLACLAASGTGDIRDLAPGRNLQKKQATGMMGRLLAAMKGGI